MPDPKEVADMIEDLGGTVEGAGIHPDGMSGFMTASFPLPENHWIYTLDTSRPPMPLRLGTDDVRHREIKDAIWAAAKYAVCCATMNGKDDDFDPDALCQQMVVGLIGYFTPDGLGEAGENPDPIPPLMPPYFIET